MSFNLDRKLEGAKERNLRMMKRKVELKTGFKETKNTRLLFRVAFCSQSFIYGK